MNRQLFWKLCITIVACTVALFYAISVLTSQTEEGMSFIAKEHQQQIQQWGREAEYLYLAGDEQALSNWLTELQAQEKTWAAVVKTQLTGIANSELNERFYSGFGLGRGVDWKIHLYFPENPIMEVTFQDRHVHFLILLPDRMRPGLYWNYASATLQIILPVILLTFLSIILYHHIMAPLGKLEKATKAFTRGDFNVRVRSLLGNRSDELSELANTFDTMASRIGELIISQRRLIADLSHELRTPLTRLEMALANIGIKDKQKASIERIELEAKRIRRLVEDTLALAWLDNEKPALAEETLDLIDLLDALVEDAHFEFPERKLQHHWPDEAPLTASSHQSLAQAIENILRNALRYTPSGKSVSLSLERNAKHYCLIILDQGPGVEEQYLERIFEPFFRVDDARAMEEGFGLGLALARRQIEAVGGRVWAKNSPLGGLLITIELPAN